MECLYLKKYFYQNYKRIVFSQFFCETHAFFLYNETYLITSGTTLRKCHRSLIVSPVSVCINLLAEFTYCLKETFHQRYIKLYLLPNCCRLMFTSQWRQEQTCGKPDCCGPLESVPISITEDGEKSKKQRI